MGARVYNFNPGPAALPLEVLEQAKEQFVEFEGLGMSLMEISHRSSRFEQLNEETERLLLELLELPAGYRALFMGGGASMQFALLPMNFLAAGHTGAYAVTGQFAEKALSEARYYGSTAAVTSSKEQGWSVIPTVERDALPDNAAYLHITANNTIEGTQYASLPETGDIPLIGDMTSAMLGRRIDYSRFSLMYAGAQKNLGPAGVTVVVVKEDMLRRANKDIPVIFRYETYVKNNSLYNTPPVHSIYMMNLVMKWYVAQGGPAKIEAQNAEKTKLIYDAIDSSGGFYQGIAELPYRSIMNVTWRLPNEELEEMFVQESKKLGFVGLAGHRSVGGLRASAYNAVPSEACAALAEFMADFVKRYG